MEEEIIVPLIVFAFIAIVVKMILDYKRDKHQVLSARHEGEDRSLGMTELRGLIREAVEEANAPLLEQISLLEAQLRSLKRPKELPSRQKDLLDEPVLLAEHPSESEPREGSVT